MAASKLLYEIVGDVTECPICTEVIVDSKVLPCIHTFCLKCLEQFWKVKKPGDQVPCPLCRTPFNIPKGGLSELPKNCFLEKLLDVQKLSNTNQSIPTCDVCSSVKNEEDGVLPPAVKYCVDCENNMCEQCAKIHLAMKSSKRHRMVKLGELSTLDTSMKHAFNHCRQHEDEKMKMFCLDCDTAVCMACFIIEHNGHKCSDIDEVAQGLKDQIRKDIKKTNERFLKVNKQSENLEKVLKEFEHDTKEAEDQIVKRGDEIKQLVDKHVQSLLRELIEKKTRKLKEFENVREEIQVQKVSLESFMKYSQKVLDKAISSEIACSARELRTRADNLSKMRIVPVGKQVKVSSVSFNLNMFTDGSNARNIVGKTSFSETIPFYTETYGSSEAILSENSVLDYNSNTTLNTTLLDIIGITISEKEIFTVYIKTKSVKVFDYETFEYLREIPIPALQVPWDITFSENILFVADYHSPGRIHRVPLNSSEPIGSWSLGTEENYLTLSTLKSSNILVTRYSLNKLIEYTKTGQLVREIHLQQGITNPRHAIQMDNDRFLVCHADSLHRVCLIDNKGQLIKSYGGAPGSGPGQMYNPHHLAADVNGFCLVVEHGRSNRVILLNDDLEFAKQFIPTSTGFKNPIRLCLDRNRERLFVADFNNSRVVVCDVLS